MRDEDEVDRKRGDRLKGTVERSAVLERRGGNHGEATAAVTDEYLRHDERQVRPDEVRELLLRRAFDPVRLDRLRDVVVGVIAIAQERRAALVPRGCEQDRDGQAEPLDVAVEIREEALLFAGRQEARPARPRSRSTRS